MSSKHTKEPWSFNFMDHKDYNSGKPGSVRITIMDFDRARKCVNSLEGIDDPEVFMAKIYKIVYELNHHLLLKSDYKELHNEALALFPKETPNE